MNRLINRFSSKRAKLLFAINRVVFKMESYLSVGYNSSVTMSANDKSASFTANKKNQSAFLKAPTSQVKGGGGGDIHLCDIDRVWSGAAASTGVLGDLEGASNGIIVKCENEDMGVEDWDGDTNVEISVDKGVRVNVCKDGTDLAGMLEEDIYDSTITRNRSKSKKEKALTPAERKQKSRAAQSSAKRDDVKLYDRERKKKKSAGFEKPKQVPMTAAERMRLMRAKRAAQSKSSEPELNTNEKDFTKVEKVEVSPRKAPLRINMYGFNEREHNRVRMAKYRAVQTNEEKEEERTKLQERMAKYRSNLTEEEKNVEKAKLQKRMAKYRSTLTEVEKEDEKEKKRDYMASSRAAQAEEEKMYDKIVKRQKMRTVRKMQSGKSHLISNLKAKKGMKVFREEGSLVEFNRRDSTPINKQLKLDKELSEWNCYSKKNKMQAEILARKKPDIVSQLNEAWRKKKEEDDEIKKKIEQAQKNSTLDYNPEDDTYFETGTENTVNYDREFHFDPATEEEYEKFSKQRDEDYKLYFETLKREKKEEQKRARNKPLEPLPEKPLSDYEKIREANIKEREILMIKAGFFTDLSACKKSIGFKTD